MKNSHFYLYISLFLWALAGCSNSGGALSPIGGNNAPPMIFQTFPLQNGALLNLNIQYGDVQIDRGRSGQAEVAVYMSSRDAVKAKAFFDQLRFYVSPDGSGKLNVQTNTFNTNWRDEDTGFARISVRIKLPETTHLFVQTERGNIQIDCFRGDMALATRTGMVRAGCAFGNEVEIQTAQGDIVVGKLQTRNSALLRTDSGKIALDEFLGANLNAETINGNIDINHINGSATCKSQQGMLDIRGVEGILNTTTTSGNQKVALRAASQLNLSSQTGEIRLTTPAKLPLDLNASGRTLEMGCLKGFVGTIQENAVQGRLNGGGGRITIQSNGKIVVDS